MSAVGKAMSQKEMFIQLIRLLKSKLKEKDMDYWGEIPCVSTAPEGREAVEIVFKPKGEINV